MRVAKVIASGEFVTEGKDGWTNAAGKVIQLSASPKQTKFYVDEAAAKLDGFKSGAPVTGAASSGTATGGAAK